MNLTNLKCSKGNPKLNFFYDANIIGKQKKVLVNEPDFGPMTKPASIK